MLFAGSKIPRGGRSYGTTGAEPLKHEMRGSAARRVAIEMLRAKPIRPEP